MKHQENNLQRLNKYTKADIIDGLYHLDGLFHPADYIIDRILAYLDEKRSRDLFKAYETADKAEVEARGEYSEWLKGMVKIYGSGESVNIANLPLEELKRGAALENKITEARAKSKNLNRKIEKILGM